jgi:hypothetical protein
MCGRVGGGFFEFPHTTTTGVYSRSAVTVARRPVTERQAFHSISSPPLSLSHLNRSQLPHTHTHICRQEEEEAYVYMFSILSPISPRPPPPLSLSLLFDFISLFFLPGLWALREKLIRLEALRSFYTHTHISFFFFLPLLSCVCVCTMHTCCVGECVYVTPHQNPQVKNTFLPFVKKEKKIFFLLLLLQLGNLKRVGILMKLNFFSRWK